MDAFCQTRWGVIFPVAVIRSEMGCGKTRNRGARSPRREAEEFAVDPTWESRGKLPLVVLKGWANALGIPFLSPNRRNFTHCPAPLMQAQDFDLEEEEGIGETGRVERAPETLVAECGSEAHSSVPSNSAHPGVISTATVAPETAVHPSTNSLGAGEFRQPPAEQECSGALSPLPPEQLREESEDEEVAGEDAALREIRLAKELQAEEDAAKVAAAQRAEMERQQAASAQLMDAQKMLADSILSKYQ